MAGRIRSSLRAVRNLFLTGLDPASLAGMAAAVAVAGEYPPPGAGGGPPEFLTGPPGQGPPAPTGGSPGEFLAPTGKRKYSRYYPKKIDFLCCSRYSSEFYTVSVDLLTLMSDIMYYKVLFSIPEICLMFVKLVKVGFLEKYTRFETHAHLVVNRTTVWI